MSQKSQVVIIGGGAIGMCAAYYLWKSGKSVTVVEKDEICAGSSYGNAGLITPSHFVPLSAPGIIQKGLKWLMNPESPFYIKPRFDRDLLAWLWKFQSFCTEKHLRNSAGLLRDLSLASRSLFDELAAELPADFGWEKKGLMMLYKEEAGYRECREMVELAAEIGVEARLLPPQEIAQIDAGLQATVSGAAYFAQDSHIEPLTFVQALSRFLSERGVVIRSHCPVEKIEHSGGRIRAVRCGADAIEGAEFILATGSWSAQLAAQLHLKLPIQPAKGYSLTLERNSYPLSVPLILTEAKVAITPMLHHLRFAGTLELAGLDLSVTRRRVEAIARAVPRYLAGIDAPTILKGTLWAGLRPCTPDGLPFIGRTRGFPNLIVASGHAMIGISLAPITGRLIAQMIDGEKTSINVEALAVERFAS